MATGGGRRPPFGKSPTHHCTQCRFSSPGAHNIYEFIAALITPITFSSNLRATLSRRRTADSTRGAVGMPLRSGQRLAEVAIADRAAHLDAILKPTNLPPACVQMKASCKWKKILETCCSKSHFKIMRDTRMSKLRETCSCFCCLVKITRDAGLQIGTSSYF